ncbi:hypothetical protein U8P80_03060 [Rhizobium beringeri]|uniref:Baseplate protein J-like domain-containing protein n=1 Tax=Rhizobium beringeri TaxID=3019934 RepID=A0ABY1XP97_9HYPH|nr:MULTISPECIES: hypothetical protein [Rhizobium]MBY5458063.1 hypothetical protein [Rhizobium leguminosarum]TBC71520.1 hypothetical protein ELH27_00935 [Rhizobium leguminosarum]TBE69438.1 hypothetical protein ELH03_00935 [Rhizobium beringeri]WSG74812.1 hypothetical protein U8P80_03060 [Rhizobium beringeri]WSH15007.1 hypothetical protein U8P74_03060 [Rhizobium beringeri]
MVELSSRHEGDRIVIELYPGDPIELGDLSSSFAALARMYERHYRQDGETAPKLYVTKLETGSVLMEIAPYAMIMGTLSFMDGAVIVADFTSRLWRGVTAFSGAPPPAESIWIEPPSPEDARDIKEFTKPLLGKNGSALGIKHARYERTEGERTVVVEYKFTESELNRAAINIDKALESPFLDESENVPREQIKREVMLFIDQANRGPGKERGRTGDRGIIPDIYDKPLPVYFRKSFQNLKSQITREVNPLTSAFVVDVHVQYIRDEPRGYVVTDIHEVIPAGGTE